MNAPLYPLEQPEGQVPLNSPWYVERPPIEADCYQTIIKPTALIRIKAPRKMGKSSLMSRILAKSEQQGYETVNINFQLVERNFLTDLDRFLQWFCANVTDALELDDEIDRYWKGPRGSQTCCTNYVQRHLLAQIDTPLVLGLDEVDRIFQYPEIAVDFFGLIRAWHEKGKNEPKWQKLHLVISHSKEVYIPLNINQSPFNVGLPIELPELGKEQVIDLVQKHGLELTSEQIDLFMAMFGGHPYLVRVALYRLAKQEIDLEHLLQIAPTEEGFFYDHLRHHLSKLLEDEALLEAAKKVVAADNPVKIAATEAFKLRSMGLVKFVGNEVIPLCDLYRFYLRDRLDTKTIISDADDTTLAAIVFTDVVNSTQLMMANQTVMRELLKRDFRLMKEICEHYQGQVLKNLGDGLLMYFSSAVKAVSCTIQIQKAIATEAATLPSGRVLVHRIGIHLGDVFLTGGDVLGAGVNIAARLQSQAAPGKICISQIVYDAVKDHLNLNVEALGERQLKGVPYGISLYQIQP
ncbi:AAA-like domain-containing protein [Planktothrix sp. FACHB-1355]|uniref:AAA-like domain-containing protein n=1 Tax=Aerosakkonema funiforme FACHB-1375 TaxID=2949571 RepID=A0A926VIS1_9CYAN|nr:MULTISPECIES: AAA-like domain-containing protein [Oscillatoriales]MBD2184455.1 AAA-like domain-containing protein [Aerosakkonema funiforme FACHB-1375]MBD3560693.1 AAA-like domain-containing protein [Planktothrix sp. FACHB-1355]